MKKQFIGTRVVTILIAVALCFAMVVPAFAATDATAPLEDIYLLDSTNYSLSPSFQQNTQVYTVTSITALGVMPTDETSALAIIGYTTPSGTTVVPGFDAAAQLLTLTTTNGADSSIYYISFSDMSGQTATSNIADINVKKILDADDTAQLDSLYFTYVLYPIRIVDDTAPVGTTTIPLATDVSDLDESDGRVDVTTIADTTSTMVMSRWDAASVATLSNTDAAAISRLDLEGKEVIDGTFSVAYTTVGQYVYLLHETPGVASGVTYEDTWYEVTVTVVLSDPSDPTSAVAVGWIEVKLVTNYVNNSNYTVGAKVNFGSVTTIDDQKYDNYTTSIMYPYVNILTTEDLVVNNTVTGNLGDDAQDFLYEIIITGSELADSYDITYIGTSSLQPVEITTNGSTGTAYITLRHAVTATIADLPVGVAYTITELVADTSPSSLTSADEAANYTTTITYDDRIGDAADVLSGLITTAGDAVTAVIVGKSVSNVILDTAEGLGMNFVSYVNDKPLTPPTGAFIDMIPYFAIVVVAFSGLIGFIVFRGRRNAYEH